VGRVFANPDEQRGDFALNLLLLTETGENRRLEGSQTLPSPAQLWPLRSDAIEEVG